MSCKPGEPCHEGLKRRRALAVLGLMAILFVALSAVSFLDSRGQAVPSQVGYAGFDAVEGKRVFQSYNCMGCHTIVGNGAYFAPDLTKLYDKAGPAWLEAFLPSAGAWPTSGAVRRHLQDPAIAAEAGTDDLDAYLEAYPAAAERIARRGGNVKIGAHIRHITAPAVQAAAYRPAALRRGAIRYDAPARRRWLPARFAAPI